MDSKFDFDVFLGYSSQDKELIGQLAERLRKEDLMVWFGEWEFQHGRPISFRVKNAIQRSRVFVLCLSQNVTDDEWHTLEAQSFLFRDPLNEDRRFVCLRMDDTPEKDSLANALELDWRLTREQTYVQLRSILLSEGISAKGKHDTLTFQAVRLSDSAHVHHASFGANGTFVLFSDYNRTLALWDMGSRESLHRFKGHSAAIQCAVMSTDGQFVVSGGQDCDLRLWSTKTGECLRIYAGHDAAISSIAISHDGSHILSSSWDRTVRLWNLGASECVRIIFHDSTQAISNVSFSSDGQLALLGSTLGAVCVYDISSGKIVHELQGHTQLVIKVEFNASSDLAISASHDETLRLWDIRAGRCIRVFEGHTSQVECVAISGSGEIAASGDRAKTIRIWHTATGQCSAIYRGFSGYPISIAFNDDASIIFVASSNGEVTNIEISHLNCNSATGFSQVTSDYTNAKVLVVGDTHSGKTGLTERLSHNTFTPSESTAGVWSTQWVLDSHSEPGAAQREIWLWDFGGQADQRLVHQLFMDQTSLILLVFDSDREDVLSGLREWITALRRALPSDIPFFLVAGRIDVGFKASRGKLQHFANENRYKYFETSAKNGVGCTALREAIIANIDWTIIPRRTSPTIFKQIKDAILRLRDQNQVLHTFKELQVLLEKVLPPGTHFDRATLKTVLSLLDGPGIIKQLAYGSYILLQPEWINAYAQAVIRTLRADPRELGCLPLGDIAAGRLLFQFLARDGLGYVAMQRLSPQDEKVVLLEMEHQLEQRFLCIRQGSTLVFPSHCGRERPEVSNHPSIFIEYDVRGFLDDIYATLVAKLALSESCVLKDLWRDAADFSTLIQDRRMGVKLNRESGHQGTISVYFSHDIDVADKVIFANYIHGHLISTSERAHRLRHYVCPHCSTPKGMPKVLMSRLQRDGEAATVVCDNCSRSFGLWDELEQLFASEVVRQQVIDLQHHEFTKLDSRRKGKLLSLEVAARISSANQKCFDIPAPEDEGIDMEMEFTDDQGRGTGQRVYLQLKSGNSHLRIRKGDGAEIFDIKDARWFDYWLKQPSPVMLVIGTFDHEAPDTRTSSKLEFNDVRWMNLSEVLRKAAAANKTVKHFEFIGERLDLQNIHRLRRQLMS